VGEVARDAGRGSPTKRDFQLHIGGAARAQGSSITRDSLLSVMVKILAFLNRTGLPQDLVMLKVRTPEI